MQHAIYTDILVNFRPMNPLTVAKNLKIVLMPCLHDLVQIGLNEPSN